MTRGPSLLITAISLLLSLQVSKAQDTGEGYLAWTRSQAEQIGRRTRVNSSSGHGCTNPSNLSEERADRQYKAAIQRLFKEIVGS